MRDGRQGGRARFLGLSAAILSPPVILLLIGRSYRQPDLIERDDRPATGEPLEGNAGGIHLHTKIGWQPLAILAAVVMLGVMFALG